MKVRHIYLKGRDIKSRNEKLVSFWLDPWLENTPLCQAYPILYELATSKSCSVAEIREKGWVVQFKIRLQGLLHDQWYELASKLDRVQLNDRVMWYPGSGL
jgi:hypothetical protein